MGIWQDATAVALAAHRLSEAEKKLAEQAAETKAAVKELRAMLQDMRVRQLRTEARLDGLDEVISTKAQANAAFAAAGALPQTGERLTRLEMSAQAPPDGGDGQPRLAAPLGAEGD